jgi:hypothetical protein
MVCRLMRRRSVRAASPRPMPVSEPANLVHEPGLALLLRRLEHIEEAKSGRSYSNGGLHAAYFGHDRIVVLGVLLRQFGDREICRQYADQGRRRASASFRCVSGRWSASVDQRIQEFPKTRRPFVWRVRPRKIINIFHKRADFLFFCLSLLMRARYYASGILRGA